MASVKIYKNKKTGQIVSCRWRCCLGRDNQGRQIVKTKTCKEIPDEKTELKIKKAWQLQADSWEQELRSGWSVSDNSTFSGFLNGDFWQLHVLGGGLKPSTIEFYKNMCPRCLEFFGNRKLQTLRPIDCEKFFVWLKSQTQKNGKPLSAASQKHYYNFLRIAFNFAEEKQYIDRSPMRSVKPPKQEHKAVDFLSADDAKAFLAATQAAPLRWRCIFQLLLLLGLRRGEVCGLQWQDIDFENGTVCIQRNATYTSSSGVSIGTPKTIKGSRTLPVPPTLLANLKSWKAVQNKEFQELAEIEGVSILITDTAFLFSSTKSPYSPVNPTNLTTATKKFCRKMGLPDMSPHDLRHTCGTLLLENGASVKQVQDFLGHEDASTTLSFYCGTDASSLKKAGDSLFNAIASAGN